MVLGLSLRKSKKNTADRQAPIRVSPSLPDIRAQSMAWPESLVDLPSYNQKGPDDLPPRTSTASNAPIATIYAREHPPSSFGRTPAAVASPRRQSTSTRRPRMPMPFNLMVAGPRGVGKTALLRLLLQMSEASVPSDALPARPTRALSSTTAELPGQDRLVLTAIDTPGLDYAPGAELELEKAVTSLVKYVDTQYAETLGEESKVVRQSKGDHHVHLCIYLIDPASIQTPAQRNQLRPSRSLSALRSDTPENSAEDWDSDSSDEDEDEPDMTESGPSRKLSMLPAEVRAIQRLSRRTNVLPIVARGDTLTDARLSRIKRVVRRDLANAGVDLRLFGIGEEEPQRGRVESRVERQEDEQERKVVKTRFRLPSRTRPSVDQQNEGPAEPLEGVHVIPKLDESALGKMFPFVVIAPDVHKAKAKRARKPTSPEVTQAPVDISRSPSVPGTPMAITTDDPDLSSAEMTGTFPSAPPEPASLASPAPNAPSRSPSTYASPGVLPPSSWRSGSQNAAGSGSTRIYPRGQYTRKYRWGTIDVLDPAHCDVGVLRGVILGSHLKALKTHTREVLYERFRTEKLLARRATQNITPEQRSRLLKGLDP